MMRLILFVLLVSTGLHAHAKKYLKLKIMLSNGEKLVGIVTRINDSTFEVQGISKKNRPYSLKLSRTVHYREVLTIKAKKLNPIEPGIGAGTGLIVGLFIVAAQPSCEDDLGGAVCELYKPALLFWPLAIGTAGGYLLTMPRVFRINGDTVGFQTFRAHVLETGKVKS